MAAEESAGDMEEILGASELGAGSDEDFDAGQGGESDTSAELTCIGCDITSKSHCPVAKKKREPFTKVKWGKQTSRRVKDKFGKHRKKNVRCGSWCSLCVRLCDRKIKHDRRFASIAKKQGPRAATNKIKQALSEPDFKARWKSSAT